MKRSILVVCIALVLAACATEKRQKQTMKDMNIPVSCAHAEGDLRALKAEKAHTEDRIAEGVSAISPVGGLVGIVQGTETTQLKVATGEYNKMIDKRIAEIKSTCGL